MWNEAGQRLIRFCQENTLVIANTFFQQHKRRLHTCQHQMVCTKIRLIIFFAAKYGEALYSVKSRLIIFFAVKDGEALYSQQKQDWELTVAQIMNFLLPNSDLS